MTLTTRGRTWAVALAAVGTLAFVAGGLAALGGPELADLKTSAARQYAQGTADPDCQDAPPAGRTYAVLDATVLGNTGTATVAVATGPGAYDSYATATTWQLAPSGAWLQIADGQC